MLCLVKCIINICVVFNSYCDIDSSVQLVCKYLNAYDNRSSSKHGINRLCRNNGEFSNYVLCVYKKFTIVMCKNCE